jgi:hypothetical protein
MRDVRKRLDASDVVGYRSRFYKGIAIYLAWLDKRPDWKTAARRTPGAAAAVRQTGNGRTATKAKQQRSVQTLPKSIVQTDDVDAVGSSVSTMVPYDLPLRPGMRARLVLPEMLTQADAARIAAFVSSLAFDQAQVAPEGV